jgi:hypothetical protein
VLLHGDLRRRWIVIGDSVEDARVRGESGAAGLGSAPGYLTLFHEPRYDGIVHRSEEPTFGVDVGSKAEIYQSLERALDGGLAVLLVSSDFEEVAGICHRALISIAVASRQNCRALNCPRRI